MDSSDHEDRIRKIKQSFIAGQVICERMERYDEKVVQWMRHEKLDPEHIQYVQHLQQRVLELERDQLKRLKAMEIYFATKTDEAREMFFQTLISRS